MDRHGNAYAEGVPYARGRILGASDDDLTKVAQAQAHIRARRERGEPVHLMSGLERRLDARAEDIEMMDDELAQAFHGQRLRDVGLAHLGGDPGRHDVIVTSRLTSALLVAADVMIRPGDVVLGVSPRYSHPAVVRAVAHARGEFTDCTGVAALRQELARRERVDALFITRLSVSYEILSTADLLEVVKLAKSDDIQAFVLAYFDLA